jgi:hypothetical protein
VGESGREEGRGAQRTGAMAQAYQSKNGQEEMQKEEERVSGWVWEGKAERAGQCRECTREAAVRARRRGMDRAGCSHGGGAGHAQPAGQLVRRSSEREEAGRKQTLDIHSDLATATCRT